MTARMFWARVIRILLFTSIYGVLFWGIPTLGFLGETPPFTYLTTVLWVHLAIIGFHIVALIMILIHKGIVYLWKWSGRNWNNTKGRK